MALFAGVSAITETEDDKITSNKFTVDSGIYDFTIKNAYITKSKSSSAAGLTLEVAVNVDGKLRSVIDTIWYANKEGQVAIDKDGKKEYTFGYKQLDKLCKVVLGKGAETLNTEPRKVEVRKGVIEDREVVLDLLKARGKVGIKEIKKNKQADNGKGVWVDTAEARTENKLDIFFTSEGQTANEVQQNTQPTFIKVWEEEFSGKVIDQFKAVTNSPTASPASNISTGSLLKR